MMTPWIILPLMYVFCSFASWHRFYATLALFLISSVRFSQSGMHEKRLLNNIFTDYNLLERPVVNESDALLVTFGLTLQQIIDVDEKNQIISTNTWLNLEWTDYNLAWNESEYGGLNNVRIPPHMLWKPDILMYNSADEDIDSTFPTNVVVYSDGRCHWVPPGLFLSTCKIDITWFPFDDQLCDMKFGSWTYDGFHINLTIVADEGDISSFIENGEWKMIGVPVKRNLQYYACCVAPYIDLTYTLHIRRRTLYYTFNLIIPCVLISSMALLTFVLPPDAGEKISLGVTILLSLTVFLLLVAETMPPTSDAVPLIGMYFACIMLMCSLSVVFTVLVLNYHHRSPDTHNMPRWVRRGICEWLAWLLQMSRPGKQLSRRKLMQGARMRDMELRERHSKSLLANVLDLDDDFRSYSANSSNMLHNPNTQLNHNNSNQTHMSHPYDSTKQEDHYPGRIELREILKELRYLTEKSKNEEDFQELCNDWKFAAMVIDRLCLLIFTTFTIVSSIAILLAAPNNIISTL